MTVGIENRDAQIGAGIFWKIRKYEYGVDGSILYEGVNETIDAKDSSPTWGIWRYYYSEGNLVKREGPVTGEWDKRASYSYWEEDADPKTIKDNVLVNINNFLELIFIENQITNMYLSLILGKQIKKEDL